MGAYSARLYLMGVSVKSREVALIAWRKDIVAVKQRPGDIWPSIDALKSKLLEVIDELLDGEGLG